jgi:hypothetical protein
MNSLSKNELKMLMKKQEGPCVSIFMTTHPAGTGIREDQTRFRNHLGTAIELLSANLHTSEIGSLLKPAQKLMQKDSFWRHLSDGLAIFLSPKIFGYYHIPLNLKEDLIVVSKRFHLKPVLSLLTSDKRFYVLAISHRNIRMFRCTRYSVTEVELKNVPDNFAEVVKHNDILNYFRLINKNLRRSLWREQSPLILAGVDYLFSVYRKANTYPYLLDEGIAGNPDRMSAEELHEKAWEIVSPYFQKEQKNAINQYMEHAGSTRVSNDINEVVPAAYYGRVESLFVAVGRQLWGTFNSSNNIVHVHQEAESGDGDLLDLAATQTLSNGGTVYAVQSEKIPDDSLLVAMFRY